MKIGLLFCLLSTFCVRSLSMEPYNYKDHPLYNVAKIMNPPVLVVVNSYFYKNGHTMETRNALYAPFSGNFNYWNGSTYGKGLDVLYIPYVKNGSAHDPNFLNVHLNHPARGFILLYGNGSLSTINDEHISVSTTNSNIYIIVYTEYLLFLDKSGIVHSLETELGMKTSVCQWAAYSSRYQFLHLSLSLFHTHLISKSMM